MKEGLKRMEHGKKLFMGSVLLTGVYFLIMWLNNSIATCVKGAYFADPPTGEMLVSRAICKTSKGIYWLEWLLPILIVWAGVFLILEVKEMLTLLCVTGCSVLLAFGLMTYDHVLPFIVNEEPLFKEEYGWEWKAWGIAVILFLFLLPLLHKKLLSQKAAGRAVFLALTLLLASVGGILITIQDFGTYSIYILARTVVLALIAGFALYMKQKMEKSVSDKKPQEETMGRNRKAVAADFFWLITGILFAVFYTVVPRPLYTHMNIPVYGSRRSTELFFCMLVFLGLLWYQLLKNRRKMPKGWFGTGLFAAGIVLLNNIVFFLVWLPSKEGGLYHFGYLLRQRVEFNLFRGVRGGFTVQPYYLFLFLTLTWVFYFLKMKRMQILNSIMGISSIWFCLFQVARFYGENSYKTSIIAAVGMLILFLAPYFPILFKRMKNLPILLGAFFFLIYEAGNLYNIVTLWENIWRNIAAPAENLIVYFVCQLLLFLLLGSAIWYELKNRPKKQMKIAVTDRKSTEISC